MKKIISIVFILMMTLTLVSCDIPLNNPSQNEEINEILYPFDRLFNDANEKSMTIIISSSNWQQLDDYMIDYDNRHGSFRDDRYVSADFLYKDQQGEVLIPFVGLRTRGNLSRVRIHDDEGNLNLSHFKISFNETLDLSPNSALYKKVVDRLLFGLEELDLKYNRNADETFISEKYAHDLMRNFGVHAQHTTLTRLYIQIDDVKTFYGLYTVFEPIDQYFISRRFDNQADKGNLYKSLWQNFGPATLSTNRHQLAIGIRDVQANYRPSYDLKTNKRTNDTSDIRAFMQNINDLSGEAFKSYIETHFDVDRFLRLIAVGALIGNPDDYRAMGNNYYLYRDPQLDQWHMIPYDYDHGFGQGWDGLGDYSLKLDLIQWKNLTGRSHPLVEKILAIEDYKNTYIDYLIELIDPENGLFHIDHYITLYDQQKNIYDASLVNAKQDLRFGLRQIREYYTDKTNQVKTQFDLN
jgi:spore coat protein H